MKFIFLSVFLLGMVACSSGTGDTTDDAGDSGDSGSGAGISIEGFVSEGGADSSLAGFFFKKAGIPSDCPDDSEDGFSLQLTPLDGSFKLATKYLHLLKEGDDNFYDIPNCTHDTAEEAETEVVTIGSTTTTICELTDAIPTDAFGTFDGIEMAIYYAQMTVPMIVPYLSDEETNYPLRVYFNNDTAQGILARDILIYSEEDGKWGWINYTDETITFVDEGRPGVTLLDAFSNDDYWCADCSAAPDLCPEESERRICSAENPDMSYKDPVTISTEDDSGGVDFTMGTESFVVAAADENHVLSLSFDLGSTLTAFENAADIDDEDHTLDVTLDCGFHPLFPSVTITDASE